MQTLTINIQNETLTKKVLWMLEHFKSDGLEISSKEDIEDLKLLKSTRKEETVSFENYLTNVN
jgi:outer membrane lipopolysaccharide assembly protein LptE/RlpB